MKKVCSVILSICFFAIQLSFIPLAYAENESIVWKAYEQSFEKMELYKMPEDLEADGAWSVYDNGNTAGTNLQIVPNPKVSEKNSSSKVFLVEKPKGNTGYQPGILYMVKNKVYYTRTVNIGVKVYIPSDNAPDKTNIFYILGPNAATDGDRQVEIYLSKDGVKYSKLKASGKKDIITIAGTNALVGEWFDLEVRVDTVKRTSAIYINGECKINDLDYLAPNTEHPEVRGVMMKINNKSASNSTCTYFDDLYIKSDYTEAISSALNSIKESDISEGMLDEVIVDLNELPKEADGVKFIWKSDNHFAIEDNGTVHRRAFDQTANLIATATEIDNYTLTAEQKNLSAASRKFKITVPGRGDATDKEILEEYVNTVFASERLTGSTEKDADGRIAIDSDLTGITTENEIGATLVWESDAPEVLSKAGVVTRPAPHEEDKDVTLTLTATKNGESYVKTFKFKVVKEMSAEMKVQKAMEEVSIEKLLNEETNTSNEPYIIKKNLTLPKEAVYDVSVTWSSNNALIDANSGSVTRGNENTEVLLTAIFEYGGVSQSKTFKFIVEMSPQAKILADRNSIDETAWRGITESFTLPNLGFVHESNIVWKSNNDAIKIQGNTAMVTRPEYTGSDLTVTLTAAFTNEGVTEEYSLLVTVAELPSNLECVTEQAKLLTWDKISWESIDDVSVNLSLIKRMEYDVYVSWKSTDSTVIDPESGVVTNPDVGKEDKTVTLTANVCKGKEAKEVVFENITVKAFKSVDELLKRAATALTFDTLSADSIDSVKSNITLEKNWKYQTAVEWKSSDNSLLELSFDENSGTGTVKRPALGTGDGIVVLTADISYAGKTVQKKFILKIPEEYREQTLYVTDCEEMEQKPSADYGTWTPISSAVISSNVVNTKDYAEISGLYSGTDNKAIMIFKPDDTLSDVLTPPYLTYYVPKEDAISGSGTIEMKVFITPDTEKAFQIQVHSTSPAGQIKLYFDTNMIRAAFNDGELVVLAENKTEKPYAGKWLNVKITVNTTEKRYKLYVDDIEITHAADNIDYDDTYGVPFNFYDNPASPTSLMGLAFGLNIETGAKTKAFVDDISIKYFPEYSEGMLEIKDEFETKFLSANDINRLSKNLVLPNLETDYIKVEYESSDEAVVSKEGKVTLPAEEKSVIYTAVITYGTKKLKCSYVLNVLPEDFEPVTDKECAEKDLNNAVKYICDNYSLNNIKEDIIFERQGKNGSTITLASGDTSVVKNSGDVTRYTVDKTVTLTVIATKNGQTAEKSLLLTVKAQQKVTQNSSGGGSSSFGTYGANKKPQTGIATEEDKYLTDISGNAENTFKDVEKEHWAYRYIEELCKQNIVNGYDGKFYPEQRVLREEFVKMLVLALNIEPKGISEFSDVDINAWYAPYVAAAVSEKIVNGNGESFGAGEYILRQDMAVMVARALKLAENNNGVKFSDDERIGDYAIPYVYAAKAAGLVGGRENNIFEPKAYVTRAEAATVICRVLSYMND